jgi:nucleotide-binding universal stress UspA family protein
MFQVRTILQPTDFSKHSTYAFQLACALARDRGARLIVLHVIPVPTLQEKFAYREEVEEALAGIRAPDPQVRLERRLEVGDPAARILEAAQAIPCDLIVVGTHGRTGLGRALLGSVAEQVVRRAPCPVLTVKTPFPQVLPAAGHAAGGIQTAAGAT